MTGQSEIGIELNNVSPWDRLSTAVVIVASLGSAAASLLLLIKHDVLSGPGDQLGFYAQAERLLPFKDHYLGPGYFVTIRLVHDLLHLDWFLAAKVISLVSAWLSLILTFLIARQLLDKTSARFATALVAINPIFISQSYSSLTIMYGAVWALFAIWATLANRRMRLRGYFAAGLIFGLASLVRFQNNGLLLGALAGFVILPEITWSKRIAGATVLLLGWVIPTVSWSAYLGQVQGSAPENYNFVHLTYAFGEFNDFFQVHVLVEKYKSTLGVLTSHWSNPLRIAAFATKEALKFPFGVGFRLLFLAAGWLLPGMVVVATCRRLHGPWLGAFLAALFLTGIGSRGWLHYYTLFIPFCSILVANVIGATDVAEHRPIGVRGRLVWALILGSTVCWSPVIVWNTFQSSNWSEYKPAVRFLEEEKTPQLLVCSTASTISYGASFAFVGQSSLLQPKELPNLVNILRKNKVTHLVVTRHTLYDYPDLAVLLEDSPTKIPDGLRRELLITSPERLAIYRVLGP